MSEPKVWRVYVQNFGWSRVTGVKEEIEKELRHKYPTLKIEVDEPPPEVKYSDTELKAMEESE